MHFQSRSNRAVVTTHEHQDQEQQQHQDVHATHHSLSWENLFMLIIFSCIVYKMAGERVNLIHVVFYRFLYVVRYV